MSKLINKNTVQLSLLLLLISSNIVWFILSDQRVKILKLELESIETSNTKTKEENNTLQNYITEQNESISILSAKNSSISAELIDVKNELDKKSSLIINLQNHNKELKNNFNEQELTQSQNKDSELKYRTLLENARKKIENRTL